MIGSNVVDSREKSYVDVVRWEATPRYKELEDIFKFREDRRAKWLQRLCCWTLKKLGCFASVETIEYRRHVFGYDGEVFMKRFWQRYDNVAENFHFIPKRLLIGSAEYAQMMSEDVSRDLFEFMALFQVRNKALGPGIADRVRIEDRVVVSVVPWMRGMLLLPE